MTYSIRAPIWFPLADSFLCLDCSTVFSGARACPTCGRECFVPLAKIVNREPVA